MKRHIFNLFRAYNYFLLVLSKSSSNFACVSMVCVCASDMNMQIESNSSIIQVKGGYKPIAQFFLSRERMNKCLINMKGKVAKISIRGRHLIINHCGSAPWGSRPIQHVLTNSILFRLRITNTINYPWPFIQLSWANIGARPVSKIVVYDAVTFFFMVCIQRDLRLVENMHKLWAVWISSDLSVRSIRQ